LGQRRVGALMPPEYDAKVFGRNLALVRQRRGLSGAQLAGRAGVRRESVCKIEMGMTSPKLVTVLALTDALELQPSELFNGLRP
jgi:transcriptional regulator with XRE-family HTH domain